MAGAHHTHATLRVSAQPHGAVYRRRLVPALLATALLFLVTALWAGLLRLGWNLPWPTDTMAVAHGPLMIEGFLGTLLSLERAVALGSGWAYVAPACSVLSAGASLAGDTRMAALAALAASGVLGLVATVMVYRQPALFTSTMALGACAWAVGNLWWGLGWAIPRFVTFWMAFPIFTVAGERLELSRLRRYTRIGRSLFVLALGTFVLGLVGTVMLDPGTARLFGAGMIALTLWLMHYDIARQTVRSRGLPRYVAVSVFCGYLWLLAAGVAAVSSPTWPPGRPLWYDAVLHSVFLGFAFSMIFAHAPIIFPALTGRSWPYSPLFYLPLAALQATVLLRVAADLGKEFRTWPWAGLGNVTAVLLFFVIALGVRAGWLRTPQVVSNRVMSAGSQPALANPQHMPPKPRGCPSQGSGR